jgi:3-hydroxyacyl-CoA dehydrogenase/enoyl-CoA hydratase/3-hydroxybutyryl-CoA epimerase
MEETLKFEMQSDVAVVTINVPNAAQNTIKPELADELDGVLERAGKERAKAVVLASDKPGSFVAGADIDMLRKAKSAEQVTEMSKKMQGILQRVESSEIPVVAAIDGACLGGGLEIALACRARVASDANHTKLGVPEVQLGVLPGGGGTQRLPRLVGIEAGLELLLTGKQLDAKRAKKMGLVDEVVAPAIVVKVASALALGLAEPKQAEESLAERVAELLDRKRLQELALAKNPLGRNFVFGQAEKDVKKKTRGHYPAPPAILEVVKTGLEKGVDAGYEAEAKAFGELAMTDVAHRLMEVFFAQQSLKKDSGVNGDAEPRTVKKVGVLGAGLMGRGVAYVTAHKAGLPVRLKDRDDPSLAAGLREVQQLIDEQVEKKRISSREAERLATRVSGSTEDDAFASCDVVIEAVFEDIDLKQKLLAATEEATRETTIFASNTSSIPISRIAEKARRKDRVVGMHYFSPVHKMPLLEVIRTDDTSDETVATAVALGKQQGKTVIVVRDGVGFYTSRILAPYMNEAARMIGDGVPIETIDRVAKEAGFPVGPITLLDEVGIDTAAKVSKIAVAAFGDRMEVPEGLQRLVDDGRTGRKGSRGFYEYGGKKKEVDTSVYEVLGVQPDHKSKHDEAILRDRLVLQMVQEAIRCFDEGIVRSARDADVGAIFGLGFPPFTGGPLRWVDATGPSKVLRRMRALEDRFGTRFSPPPRLEQMAREGGRFHED